MTTFNSFGVVPGTTDTTLYTCPANKIAIIMTLQVANVSAAAVSATVSATLSGTTVDLCNGLTVPTGAAINAVAGKLVLKAGDVLTARTSTASSIHIAGSLSEVG